MEGPPHCDRERICRWLRILRSPANINEPCREISPKFLTNGKGTPIVACDRPSSTRRGERERRDAGTGANRGRPDPAIAGPGLDGLVALGRQLEDALACVARRRLGAGRLAVRHGRRRLVADRTWPVFQSWLCRAA